MAKYAAAEGTGGTSPLALRHTFASHHVCKGAELDVVCRALCHESLVTTSAEFGREVMDQELLRNAL